jgi:hypothetical protein
MAPPAAGRGTEPRDFVAAGRSAVAPELEVVRQDARRQEQALERFEAELRRLRAMVEREVARVESELAGRGAAVESLSEAWERRFHDLATALQLLVAVAILVLGGLLAALMAIAQRLRTLQGPGEPPARLEGPVGGGPARSGIG